MNINYDKQLTHERLADEFDTRMNHYDLERRLTILIDKFLALIDLKDKLVLDAGCGTGEGSRRLTSRGAHVVSYDLGYRLLQITQTKCECEAVRGDVLRLPFADNTFDVVFSTEVIEHTPDPLSAFPELIRVLVPGGYLSLSTPNRLWHLPVRLASTLHLRPYDGLENFVSPQAVYHILSNMNGKVIHHQGIHILPFYFSFLHPLLRYIDKYGSTLLPLMINQAVLFQKEA
jgi:2-polyprenyl-3-methyl-5-hydroxy-6-metoxy-1,4-benzoquinol methylase